MGYLALELVLQRTAPSHTLVYLWLHTSTLGSWRHVLWHVLAQYLWNTWLAAIRGSLLVVGNIWQYNRDRDRSSFFFWLFGQLRWSEFKPKRTEPVYIRLQLGWFMSIRPRVAPFEGSARGEAHGCTEALNSRIASPHCYYFDDGPSKWYMGLPLMFNQWNFVHPKKKLLFYFSFRYFNIHFRNIILILFISEFHE